jgi:hypothetical protein
MSDSAREQLLGHLLGALESDEQADIEAQLGNDPECRKELALLRKQLEPLAALKQDFAPPEGLAERACLLVEQHRAKPAPAPSTGGLRPEVSPPCRRNRMSRLDVIMATLVASAAVMLILPAIQNSRAHARLNACTDNLRDLGVALNQYSQTNQGYFPKVPANGNLAAAGIYAPILADKGLLTDVRRVVCPDSDLASRVNGFRVPTYGELKLAPPTTVVGYKPTMGGSYGYNLGYVNNGEVVATKNHYRDNFAIMSDAPSLNTPNFQSANHGGRGQNVLFESGAVRFLQDTKIPGSNDDIFTNNAGRMAAGLDSHDSVLGASSTAPVIFTNSSK